MILGQISSVAEPPIRNRLVGSSILSSGSRILSLQIPDEIDDSEDILQEPDKSGGEDWNDADKIEDD